MEEEKKQSQELKPITAFSLRQLPIIEQNLIAISELIDAKLAELNLENQIATEDTVQHLKKTKAELNKWFSEFDTERKEIKKLILEPYNIINEQYENKIASKLNNALDVLTKKIVSVELNLKQNKQNILIQYFNELKTLYKIDWLTWEQMNIEMKISTTEKQYKKDIMDKFKEINDAIQMINTQEYAAEILVEYKRTLNASNAITLVIQRKDAEKLEKEKLLQQRTKNREQKLENLGCKFNNDGYSTFGLFISHLDNETLDKEEWNKRYVEFENVIKQQSETPNVISEPTIVNHTAPEQSTPHDPVLFACIEITGTKTILQSVTKFLKENGITYRNIKEYNKD